MLFRRRMTLFVAALIVATTLPGVAFGHVYYQGDDYSKPINNRLQIGVCDHERDLNEAYTKFHRTDGALRQVRDHNGFGGSCGYSDRFRPKVFDHKTCEARTVRPDECNKKYLR